jgi:uncharacterized membrane protein YczE
LTPATKIANDDRLQTCHDDVPMNADDTTRTVRAVPSFSWSSSRTWTLAPRPIGVLVVGLVLFGVGDWLVLASRFGNTPWTVLAEGLSKRSGIGIGWMTVLVSFAVLTCWAALHQRPGLGTIANALIVGTTVEMLQEHGPHPSALLLRTVMVAGGIVTVAVGGALYLSAQLGPGPRDGLMTGLGRRFNWPIARVRLAIELGVLAVGALLGGKVGLGTVLFAVLIGHVLAFLIARLHEIDRRWFSSRSG